MTQQVTQQASEAEHWFTETNYHVVDQARRVLVCFPSYPNRQLVTDPQYYLEHVREIGLVGTVVARDDRHDLALVQLEKLPSGVRRVPLAAKSASPGETVHSIGASGVERNLLEGTLWGSTSGQVRQVYEKDYDLDGIQHISSYILETSAPTNPGDSGGPVVNDRLQLVALVSSLTK